MVQKFCYLGSTITSTVFLDSEINRRTGKAATTFGKRTKRAWYHNRNKHLTMKTKAHIYDECLEHITLRLRDTDHIHRTEKEIELFHLRCVRKILDIKWQDRVPNSRVLEMVGLPSGRNNRDPEQEKEELAWLCLQDGEHLYPKEVLVGELTSGQRPRGSVQRRVQGHHDCTCRSIQSPGNRRRQT